MAYLIGDGDAVVDEAADRVERLFQVGAETVLGLQVDDERHARGIGDLAHPGFASGRVTRISARKHHGRGKVMATQQAGLIDGAAERWTEARNRPPRRGEVGQPVEERFVLGKRDVVEERVAAVEEARDASVDDVPGDLFGGVEIEAAAAVGFARERRDGIDAPQVFESESVASHVGTFPMMARVVRGLYLAVVPVVARG